MLRHVVQLLSPLVYRVRMVNALKHFAPPFAPSSLAMPRPFRHRDSQRRESLHDEASGAQRYDPVRPGHIKNVLFIAHPTVYRSSSCIPLPIPRLISAVVSSDSIKLSPSEKPHFETQVGISNY